MSGFGGKADVAFACKLTPSSHVTCYHFFWRGGFSSPRSVVISLSAGPQPFAHEQSARWIATIAANPHGQHHLMPSGHGRLDRSPSHRRKVRDTAPWSPSLQSCFLLTSLCVKIESENTGTARRPFQYVGMTQCAPRIVIASAPMLLHVESRKLVVLGMALIGLRAIDQMNDVVDRAIGGTAEQSCFRTAF
jgi:hypothetical protein